MITKTLLLNTHTTLLDCVYERCLFLSWLVGGDGNLLFNFNDNGGDMNKADYIHLFKEACGGRCNAEYNPCVFRQAADSLTTLKQELAQPEQDERLRKDANRYRWLKKYISQLFMMTEKQMNEQVDRAMSGGVLNKTPCECIDQFWCATFDRCKKNDAI
jgi:hypothetical protein